MALLRIVAPKVGAGLKIKHFMLGAQRRHHDRQLHRRTTSVGRGYNFELGIECHLEESAISLGVQGHPILYG